MEGKFQKFHVDASCIMSLKDCNWNKLWICFHKRVKQPAENSGFSYFANDRYDELGISEIKATIVDYVQIDAMLYERRYFRSEFFQYSFY